VSIPRHAISLHRVALLLLDALSLGSGTLASAQQGRPGLLHGHVVVRASGEGVPGARVVLNAHDTIVADTGGRFDVVREEGHYLLEVSAPGYSPEAWRIKLRDGKTLEHVFELEPAYELPGVVVEGKRPPSDARFADFERRRHSGTGYFITQEQIERSRAATLVDVLARVRGIEQVCTANDCLAKMVRSPPGCLPQYFLDGHESTPYFARHTPPRDIRGIEIYRGSSETPAEFLGTNSGCGVIAIWTKSAP